MQAGGTMDSQSATNNLEADAKVIFCVEDDADLQTILTFNLQKEGYKVRCFAKAEELLSLLDAAPNTKPNAIVMDVNLAGHMNGVEATRFLRKTKATAGIPVLMLTAKGEGSDIVKGLEEGADDYLPKPFDMEVLYARLKSCIRRGEQSVLPISPSKKKIEIAGIEIDQAAHKVIVLGKETPLTMTEYGLLASLMNHPNEVLNRDDLLLRLVGPNKTVTGRTIDVHVRALRAKLGKKARHISTVRGVGYKFIL